MTRGSTCRTSGRIGQELLAQKQVQGVHLLGQHREIVGLGFGSRCLLKFAAQSAESDAKRRCLVFIPKQAKQACNTLNHFMCSCYRLSRGLCIHQA